MSGGKRFRSQAAQSSGSTISTAVTTTVILGQGGYGNTLTIAADGSVSPSVTGATAIFNTGQSVALYTMGVIDGGAGEPQAGGLGGTAVSITGGLISNDGTIEGGAGGGSQQPDGLGGTGGTGVTLYEGTLINSNSIAGGAGGYGTFFGYGGAGVAIDGGTLTNSGQVVGGDGGGPGVEASNSALANYGVIAGGKGAYPHGDGGMGLSLDGGTLLNAASIYGASGGDNNVALGGQGGVGAALYSGTITNTGTIGGGYGEAASNGGAGVVISGGLLTNEAGISGGNGGQIIGEQGADGGAGVALSGGTLINGGTVTGGQGTFDYFGGAGVSIVGALVSNSGTITGGVGAEGEFGLPGFGGAGAYINNGTLTDAGTIVGGYGDSFSGPRTQADAVQFGTLAGTLVVDPGAVFIGAVVASADAGDVLELSGSVPGALAGLGTEFSNFGTIDFAAGAIWSVAGTTDALATGQAIENFVPGDTLVLDDFVETGSLYVSGTGLELDSASGSATLDIVGDFTTQDFGVSTNGTETSIELCYLRGTRILTSTGEVPIENLRIGDRVVTRFGAIQKVNWIGRQSRPARSVRSGKTPAPVRIREGALGDGLPARDLFVSPGHSMLLGGVLVLASNLLNGVTITQELPAQASSRVEYYQIDLGAHDCIIAEGVWSETFADGPAMRDAFDNAAEFYRLYPDAAPVGELSLCAPRPACGAALQEALYPVAAVAAAEVTPGPLEGYLDDVIGECRIGGWARDLANPHLPVLLDVVVQGVRIGSTLACGFRDDLIRAGKGDGRCAFAFTTPRRLSKADRQGLAVIRAADGAMLPGCKTSHDTCAA